MRWATVAVVLALQAAVVCGGLGGSDVDKAKKVANTVPRFTGPDNLDVEVVVNSGSLDATWTDESGSSYTLQDYLINLGVLAGVGIFFALFAFFWMIFRALCGKCCHCWRCNCCCERGHDTTGTTVFLAVLMIITFAFCVVGYKANSQVNHSVQGDTGMTTLLPGYMDIGHDAVTDVNGYIQDILDLIDGIVDDVSNVYLPEIRDNVTKGTTDLKDEADALATQVTDTSFYNITDGARYMDYKCLICSEFNTDISNFLTEVSDQTDSIVADFNATVNDVETELVDQAGEIKTSINSTRDTTDDIDQQMLELRSNMTEYTDEADKYEKMRKIGFIVLFLFPLATVPFILIGIARKRESGSSMFTVAIYLCYIYIFCTFLVFAIHLPFATLMADSCVYGDNYEATTLPAKADECDANPNGTSCDVYRYARACINGTSLLDVQNISSEIDYSEMVVFPEVPDLNASFTFDELTDLTDFVAVMTAQDLGFPQCFLDLLRNELNGDAVAALAPAAPTTTEDVRRALWIQEHLGYELKVPFATVISTHNSYNRQNNGTHLQIDTVLFNRTIFVDETTTNQNYTLLQQLDWFGVRFIELDVHHLVPGTGSGFGVHCEAGLGTSAAFDTTAKRTRVCHAKASYAQDLRDNCADADIGWGVCETVCLCDYGDSTGCSIHSPMLSEILYEIRSWLQNNTQEVLGIYLENHVYGEDETLRDIINEALGDLLLLPLPLVDYTDTDPATSPWPTRDQMVATNKRVVIFTDPSSPDDCTAGRASSTLNNTFCQYMRDGAHRYTISTLSGCDDSTNSFFDYVTGTTLVQRILFEGIDDQTVDDTNGGVGTITTSNIGTIHDCGFSPDMDQINEDLAAAALWSWDTNEPADQSAAAVAYMDASSKKWKTVAASSGTTRVCACQSTTDPLDWTLSAVASAFGACSCDVGYAFRCPRSAKENVNLQNALEAGGPPANGAFVNLQLDATRTTITANGIARTWANTAATVLGFGYGGTELSENDVYTADPNSFVEPFKTGVIDMQKLIDDKRNLTARLDAITDGVNNINDIADSLLVTYNNIQDVIDQVENDTQPIFDAADAIIEIFDTCAGMGNQYFKMKDTMCNELVEGAAGIAMAGFFIGLFGLFTIFTLGAMIKGSKDARVFDDDDDGYNTHYPRSSKEAFAMDDVHNYTSRTDARKFEFD